MGLNKDAGSGEAELRSSQQLLHWLPAQQREGLRERERERDVAATAGAEAEQTTDPLSGSLERTGSHRERQTEHQHV
ncbi:hypothetical protein FQA47_021275 [Oryzias melastigma]|uniref:Uncharacterized protein n=1 Tax=Oryzias melastigma TaxID=30732 RepID=A0A834FNZ7_ORYME|nr:hypothetical protein FQA47_021275 [Oryzias melastigma]